MFVIESMLNGTQFLPFNLWDLITDYDTCIKVVKKVLYFSFFVSYFVHVLYLSNLSLASTILII